MSPDRARAARIAEVRRAARSWHEAGAIDAPTLASIDAAYPAEQPALARAWKVLLFVIVSVAVTSVFFGLVELAGLGGGAGIWLLFGALLTAATEALHRSRLRDNGSAAATSFWAAVGLVVGFDFGFLQGPNRDYDLAITLWLLAACIVFAAACGRWGYEVYGIFSAVAFYLFLAQLPGARLSWIAAGIVLVAGTARYLDLAALAPPHRRALAGVFAVSAVALYGAVNRFSVDRLLVEHLDAHGRQAAQPSTPALIFASLATALVPIVFVGWGLRARRMLPLDLGVLFAALSLATLRYYVHLAPLWTILCAAGAALILGALWLNRRLRASAGGEWRGFTARTLSSGATSGGLQAAAVIAGFSPEAAPGPDRQDFELGGGRFGGGGASGSF